MKKLLAILLVMVLCLGVVVSAASPEGNISKEDNDKKVKQLNVIERMENNSNNNNKEFKIQWNKEKGVPRFVTGKLSEEAVNNDSEAIDFLLENKDMFKLNKADFKLKNVEKDQLGTNHYKVNQLSDGIPVYGAEAIVHTDAEGNVYAVNGNIDNTVPEKSWKSMISLNEKKAIKAAEASLKLDSKNQEYGVEPTAQVFVYNNEGEWMPIYYVTLQFMEPYAANMKVFVNAATGDVIKTRNEIQTTATTGTGVSVLGDTRNLNIDLVSSTYYLRDLSRGAQILTYNANYGTSLPGTLFSDTDNVFNASIQKAGVDAHSNAAIVYDFYKNVLGRNSFDNAGAAIKSTVHYDSSYNNAFWNGSQMVYGDGDGSVFIPLSAALDVIGHEFTHAVTSYTADLEYQDQPGALNESMSDVFGYLIEPNDWLIGEDVYTPNVSGDALRSMSNPELYDQPAHMDDYLVTTSDYGGVHTNCGIPNKAFYLAATSINNNTYMANIYYRALTTYLGVYSDFEDGKAAFEQAATDLYGTTVAQKITDAFVAVGVGGTTPPPVGNDTYEPNGTTTAAYGPIASGTTYNSYIYSSTDVDYYKFTTTAAGTIAVTCTNLAGDYDIYLYNSAGTSVASSLKSGTTNESISYSSTAAGTYYVKVLGYNGVYSTSQAYALTATYPTSTPPTGQWYNETTVIQSPHDYTNNYNNTQTYTKTGATKVAVHFSTFATETNYDFVYIKDAAGTTKATYSGTKSAFTAEVDGDTIQVNLVSDYSVTGYGYYIDYVSYYSNGQLIIENIAPNTMPLGSGDPDQL